MTNNLFLDNVHISALVLEPGGGDEVIEENSYYFDYPLRPDLKKKNESFDNRESFIYSCIKMYHYHFLVYEICKVDLRS